MSKREQIDLELGRLSDTDLDRLLEFLHNFSEEHGEASILSLAAQSSLAKDWFTPEEDAVWANL